MSTTSTQQLDRDLVRRVQRGDTAAFDLLVRKYQHKVASLIGRHIHDRGEVQDVAQDTFVRAWRALDGFRGDAKFSTWLYRIAVNTAKNHLVARRRRPPRDDFPVDEAAGSAVNPALRDGDTPERQMMRRQLEQTLIRTVQALPEELRLAITLREIDGLDYETIARQTGCALGTVRSRIFRAREAIDKEIKPLLEVETRAERARR